jgi:site-specific DNA-methyltransferase (adenine-specific)
VNQLYFGDNLNVLRDHIKDESVDLIYLDPPFNSKRDYNLLFKSPVAANVSSLKKKTSQSGLTSAATDYSSAQITAFEDSWHWGTSKGSQAEVEFDQIIHGPNTEVAEMMIALRKFLGENDMMAYLTMMANRLLQLHRVLKPTGSLYLHCDPTASHYLKIVLDGVFGKENFLNEIIWKRQSAHSDAKHKFSNVADVILFYQKSNNALFNPQYAEHDETYLEKFYRFDDNDGRGRYRLGDMASPNPRPNMM